MEVLGDLGGEHVEGYDPEEAATATEEWLGRVPPGDEPVEHEAEADGGSGS